MKNFVILFCVTFRADALRQVDHIAMEVRSERIVDGYKNLFQTLDKIKLQKVFIQTLTYYLLFKHS